MIGILTSPLHKPARVQKPAWLKSLEDTERNGRRPKNGSEWLRTNGRRAANGTAKDRLSHAKSKESQCLDERESAKSFAYEAAVSRERMRRRFFGARERTRENSSLDEKVNKAEQRNSNVRKKPGAGRRWRTSRSVERDCIIPWEREPGWSRESNKWAVDFTARGEQMWWQETKGQQGKRW